jgi:hypothetical protein
MADAPDELDKQIERLDDRIEKLRKHVPEATTSHPDASSPPLTCPCCGLAMQAGKVLLHGTLGTFLALGMGLENGWFQPDAGGAEEMVLHSTKPRRAYLCERCRTVVLLGSDPVT